MRLRSRHGEKAMLKNKQMSLESYFIEQRVFCESPGCIDLAKVCRDIDGEKTVLCWQHDPETIQSFAEWLASTDDAIGDATDFNEWLHNRGDNI